MESLRPQDLITRSGDLTLCKVAGGKMPQAVSRLMGILRT